MSKCKTCKHKNIKQITENDGTCFWCLYNQGQFSGYASGYEERKPNRYEQFRKQTATIDGFIEWMFENGSCLSTCAYHERCKNGDEVDCKAGIKEYWESEAE